MRGRSCAGSAASCSSCSRIPYASLDPRMRVGSILREPLVVQGIGNRAEQEQRVLELLSEVGLAKKAYDLYPHEFSGGQRQRIGFARALTLNPRLIVADEPVSALDVSIQAQILNLMKGLQDRHQLSYIVISHDLAVVKYLADRIGVMYLGKLVEVGPSQAIYEHAAHPYTRGLIDTIPVAEPAVARSPAAARSSPASCRRPSTRRRAAASAPAARTPRTSAPRRSRRCGCSEAATWPPATSRSRAPWPRKRSPQPSSDAGAPKPSARASDDFVRAGVAAGRTCYRRWRRTSSESRRASPMKLKATTTRVMATPAKTISHQYGFGN